MFNYTNLTCDICNEKFTKDSDIVVCPECGTPHHRHCYKELGHCLNHTKHKAGYEWQNPNDIKPEITTEKICPKCNRKNDFTSDNCGFCGFAFNQSEISTDNSQNQNPETMANDGNIPVVTTPFPKSPLDFIQQLNNDLSSEIDGVLVKDIAIYLGPNSYDYIRKFKRMSSEKSYRPFSFIAFLFGWPFFFYRKMWDLGLISFIVSMVSSYLLSDVMLNPSLIYENPSLQLVSLGTLVFSVLLGFLAYPAIKKKTINDLKMFKEKSKSTDEYYKTITLKAGPSKMILILGFLYWIFLLFGGF